MAVPLILAKMGLHLLLRVKEFFSNIIRFVAWLDCRWRQSRLVRRFIMLNLHHYDRPSLLAGKLHAVISRKFTKGRDLYDLALYLSDPDWPEPNLVFLNNALRQTDWDGSEAPPENWRRLVAEHLQSI